jgi:WD40 repeat protein
MRYGAAKMFNEDKPMILDDLCYKFRPAVFSPDGRYVAASHRDGIVKIWEVCTGKLMRRLETRMEWVNDVAFMPDGKGLLGGSDDRTVKYWDIGNLYTPRSDARSQARNGLHLETSGVEDQTREFLGHRVRWFSMCNTATHFYC